MTAGVSVSRVGTGVVIRPDLDRVARPFDTLTDADWDLSWETPMRATIAALGAAYRDGVTRIVVLVPTIAMSGGAMYAHVAAPAEALRVLVKAAARNWGPDGVTVNAVAVAPTHFIDTSDAGGLQSLSPPALLSADASAVVEFLCSERASDVTGQTITVDGGVWM